MIQNSQNKIPQIIALAKISKAGKIGLRKSVREHLGVSAGDVLYLTLSPEICVSSKNQKGIPLTLAENFRIQLPESAMENLKPPKDYRIAIVERKHGVALKTFRLKESDGEEALWIEHETEFHIVREIQKNPMPDVVLKNLRDEYKSLKLKYDVIHFLTGKQTFPSWKARQMLYVKESSDEVLRLKLIEDILSARDQGGSWHFSVPVTARHLRELFQLGYGKKSSHVKKGIDWLLHRPESEYMPGLWTVTDDLVAVQSQVIEERKRHSGKGPRPRFKLAKSGEHQLVQEGDHGLPRSCGPRVMWTSALVLESLLLLDCENEDRVQRAIRTLSTNPHWCDNTYQHGLSTWSRTEPLSLAMIEPFMNRVIRYYRCGGIPGLESFYQDNVFQYFERAARLPSKAEDRYLLKMPVEIGEGCKVVMTRALRCANDPVVQKLIEFHLWEFAGLLNFGFLKNAGIQYTKLTKHDSHLLHLFSLFDHPVAKVVITRALPIIVQSQNRDGSWGSDSQKEVTTLGVLSALTSLENLLPPQFLS